jgi:recombination protein RecR
MPTPIPPSLEKLITHLMKLPTIGRRSAERLAFHLIRSSHEQVNELADALVDAKDKLRTCSRCFNLTEDDPCPICLSPQRDSHVLCVVENAMDAFAIETSGGFRGHYHVLGGCLSPLRGVTASDLTLAALIERVEKESVRELVLATNPSVEGEATALYLIQTFHSKGIRLTRIAMGLPMGGSLEHADAQTLQHALAQRTTIEG